MFSKADMCRKGISALQRLFEDDTFN